VNEPTTLIIGPEGGFIPYEIEKLREQDVKAVTIGERILRVEAAVPALISRLYPG
jgi:RsmE family RNA methyltransferase